MQGWEERVVEVEESVLQPVIHPRRRQASEEIAHSGRARVTEAWTASGEGGGDSVGFLKDFFTQHVIASLEYTHSLVWSEILANRLVKTKKKGLIRIPDCRKP